jgi:type I restriction enzyme M protein
MGMVLPEGVLNNKNLQAVREYFEGRAKLILICSIPQDVFIAAGATVKPSLVFMRRFTADEEAEYAKCKTEALDEARDLHRAEIDDLDTRYNNCVDLVESLKQDLKDMTALLRKAKKEKSKDVARYEKQTVAIKQQQIDNSTEKKVVEKQLKELEKKMIEDSKPIIKKEFDYDIPIAKIDDAGITTTGTASDGNQLPQLVREYSQYRTVNMLWTDQKNSYSYRMNDVSCFRVGNDQEVVLN